MTSKWRRYEVLLPTTFNDGREVPPDWLADALLEIVERFGAASYETQPIEGHWRHAGVTYRDTLVKLVVDVRDSKYNRVWLKLSGIAGKPSLSKSISGWSAIASTSNDLPGSLAVSRFV